MKRVVFADGTPRGAIAGILRVKLEMIGVADQEKLEPVEPIRNGYLRQVEKMPDDAEMWKKLSKTRKCGPKIVEVGRNVGV